jgi:hypothetical protein
MDEKTAQNEICESVAAWCIPVLVLKHQDKEILFSITWYSGDLNTEPLNTGNVLITEKFEYENI